MEGFIMTEVVGHAVLDHKRRECYGGSSWSTHMCAHAHRPPQGDHPFLQPFPMLLSSEAGDGLREGLPLLPPFPEDEKAQAHTPWLNESMLCAGCNPPPFTTRLPLPP